MVCPLCGQQKARRLCPALDRQICPVCCGTKRLTEIACPSDCVYLAVAREHPPAVAVRRQKHDVGSLLRQMRDFSDQQAQLFFLTVTFLLQYQPPELNLLIDADVVDATEALAATFETAARGVIYEHRAASLPAERLVNGLKPMLMEAGRPGGSAFQRDAAVVLRRVAAAAREVTAEDPANRRAFLELLSRVIRAQNQDEADRDDPGARTDDAPRIIIP